MAELNRKFERPSPAPGHLRSISRRFFLFWRVTAVSLLSRKWVKDTGDSLTNRLRTSNGSGDTPGVRGSKRRYSGRDRVENGKTEGSNDLARGVAVPWDLSGHTVQVFEPGQDSGF